MTRVRMKTGNITVKAEREYKEETLVPGIDKSTYKSLNNLLNRKLMDIQKNRRDI